MSRVNYVEIEVTTIAQIKIYCDTCGKDLTDYSSAKGNVIEVSACQDCLDEEYNRGYTDGKEDE